MIYLYKVQLKVDKWSRIYPHKWSHFAAFTCNQKDQFETSPVKIGPMMKTEKNILLVYMNHMLSKHKILKMHCYIHHLYY